MNAFLPANAFGELVSAFQRFSLSEGIYGALCVILLFVFRLIF
jgi:hypothetical protein